MPSILLPTTFTDPDLDNTTDLKTQLLAEASLIQWLQTDEAYGTLASGRIATLVDLKSALTWTASVSSNGPLLETQATYAGFKAASFEATVDRSLLAPAALDFSGTWSIVMLVKRGSSPASGNAAFFSQYGTGNETTLCQSTNAANLQLFHKGTGINIPVGSNAPDTTPKIFIASFDGTTLKGSVAGGSVISGTPSGGVASSTTSRIGRSYASNFGTGNWSDFMFFTGVALHATANATLLQKVLDYFDGTYSV